MGVECSRTCGGLCCRRFHAPDPERIERLVRQGDTDAKKVQEMLVPTDGPDDGRPWYTCKHFDRENGTCLNYADRPEMCSRFPYNMTCSYQGYQGCRWIPGKYGLHPGPFGSEKKTPIERYTEKVAFRRSLGHRTGDFGRVPLFGPKEWAGDLRAEGDDDGQGQEASPGDSPGAVLQVRKDQPAR